MQERNDRIFTSAFTLGEVLAGAYRKGAGSSADEVREVLLSLVSEVVPFNAETAVHYGRIRGTHGVTSPDAIHLACAAQAGIDLFLTNDNNLVGKVIPGIHFIAGLNSDII
jgi:predicted nucleic acid-binding protein